jgi:hypothetical protein
MIIESPPTLELHAKHELQDFSSFSIPFIASEQIHIS